MNNSDSIKTLSVQIPAHFHFIFMNKIKYHKLTKSNVLCLLIEKFNNGDFDELFNLPKKPKPRNYFFEKVAELKKVFKSTPPIIT